MIAREVKSKEGAIMGDYEVRVSVEVMGRKGSVRGEAVKIKDGSYKVNISEEEAISIDRCEEVILQTSYEAMRDAISKHLTQISKKEAMEGVEGGEVITNDHPYEVDGEVGRFRFLTHRVEKGGETIYDTARDVFCELSGKEKYKTVGFKEIGMIYGTVENSYRETAGLINRIRYQQGATPMRTLQDNTEKEGSKVIDFVERKTKEILKRNNFTEEGIPKNNPKVYKDEPVLLPQEEIKDVIEECELSTEEKSEVERNPVCYEDSKETVNISIDDVGVKKQKEQRGNENKGDDGSGKKKYVHNTIAHIQKEDKSYTVNSYSIVSTLRIIIGFLVNNDLLNYRLQFFADGQKSLQEAILKAFSWFSNIGLILDWYHLEDKCKMQLSMALKNRHIRNDVLDELSHLLWFGMVDKAIGFLRSLNQDLIKNKDEIVKLIKHLERNQPYIPSYGVRKKLGLRNSSNIGEKMNDLVVSDRQKHNGMSWSNDGSVALASVTQEIL